MQQCFDTLEVTACNAVVEASCMSTISCDGPEGITRVVVGAPRESLCDLNQVLEDRGVLIGQDGPKKLKNCAALLSLIEKDLGVSSKLNGDNTEVGENDVISVHRYFPEEGRSYGILIRQDGPKKLENYGILIGRDGPKEGECYVISIQGDGPKEHEHYIIRIHQR